MGEVGDDVAGGVVDLAGGFGLVELVGEQGAGLAEEDNGGDVVGIEDFFYEGREGYFLVVAAEDEDFFLVEGTIAAMVRWGVVEIESL